uniref:Uncharacterized protein n=1 Tax=Bionectria ochroleuca TaxID=29856 RepID=A0A8H7K4Z5_BIOOC
MKISPQPTADQQAAGYVISDGAGARVRVGEQAPAPAPASNPDPDPDPASGPMVWNTAAVAGAGQLETSQARQGEEMR